MDLSNELKRVIALGFFDGVHVGHAALLQKTAEQARAIHAESAALTFTVHPASRIGGQPIPLINSMEDRIFLIRTLYSIEEVIPLPFDDRLMHMAWEQFISDYLLEHLSAGGLVAGHDFHFGWKGQGDPQKLSEACARFGIGCHIIGKIELDGITVSSTYIRSLLDAGDMELANRYLGHPHMLTSTVEHGKGLGRSIGIPTVNLTIPNGVITPAYGGYITRILLENGEVYPAVTNIGVRPTVDDDKSVSVESHILNYSGNLYGKRVRLEFFSRIRPEIRFPSLFELTSEIQRNIDATRRYFESHR
jgi:riboflavin kinase/FMN adenylyltransferase